MRKKFARYGSDMLLLLGGAFIVVGVALIHVPSALIVGGLGLVFGVILGGVHGSAR